MISACFLAAYINTSRPRRSGRHFADDILKCIFLKENNCILIRISLKFVPQWINDYVISIIQWHIFICKMFGWATLAITFNVHRHAHGSWFVNCVATDSLLNTVTKQRTGITMVQNVRYASQCAFWHGDLGRREIDHVYSLRCRGCYFNLAQYERARPSHSRLRPRHGASRLQHTANCFD